MKVQLHKIYNNYWRYTMISMRFTQEEYDYTFKCLDFDKLFKVILIHFNNTKTEKWFYKTYIESCYLECIYSDSFEGYKWLIDNWGKGMFKTIIIYQDKQELKTVVNRIINIEIKKVVEK